MKRDKNIIKSFRISKKVVGVACGAAVVCVIIASMVFVSRDIGKEETVVYRETTVEYGDLTVGVTEDSEVSIGTTEQTFDLDISALVDSDSSSSQSSSSDMGMNMQMGNGGMMSFSFGSNSFASQAQEMEVEKVHITVGQEIAEGDVLYTLTESSVNEIRSQLEAAVADTLEEYEALQVEQQEDRAQAKQGYDTYTVNGKLASIVYEQSMAELNKAVTDAEKELLEKQNQYNEDLEDEIEQLQEENENLVAEIAKATRSWNEACRKLESGKLEAQQTLETDQYYASVASEWYSIQTEGLDNESSQVYRDYTNAVEKLESFDEYISGTDVISEYSGVITEVMLSEGDSMTSGTSLVTLYNQDEVTMDVSISEDDYQSFDMEGKVNISFTAYSDDTYTGVISEVSDAEYDSSSGEIYYTLTVTLQGDTSGLYEGMTGEVTFVTKETQEVLYVSNRAIFRDGTRSYVKVRDEAGNIQEKDVVTGFSDGVNVEIVEGLSEGDTVLIESKVSES